MTSFVPITAGQFVLAFDEPYFDSDRSLAENLMRLAYRSAGWDYTSAGEDVLLIRHVSKLMPKTYVGGGETRHGWQEGRYHRDSVVASADKPEPLADLRFKLIAIGVAADDYLEERVRKFLVPIEPRVRAKAIKKIHAALPHIFGRDA